MQSVYKSFIYFLLIIHKFIIAPVFYYVYKNITKIINKYYKKYE